MQGAGTEALQNFFTGNMIKKTFDFLELEEKNDKTGLMSEVMVRLNMIYNEA